jgi:hypothetical protein
MLAHSGGGARKQSEMFPQSQDCQSEAAALRVRFADPRPPWQNAPTIPNPEPRTRLVTNCRRLGFQFLLKSLELTGLHFGSMAGSIWEKLYGLNGDGERDLIVHVSHVQPAASIRDPTITTNPSLLAFADRLQHAYARFDGRREPLEAMTWTSSDPTTPSSANLAFRSAGSSSSVARRLLLSLSGSASRPWASHSSTRRVGAGCWLTHSRTGSRSVSSSRRRNLASSTISPSAASVSSASGGCGHEGPRRSAG